MPLARLAVPFDHREWIFEPKLDGFRALARVENGHCPPDLPESRKDPEIVQMKLLFALSGSFYSRRQNRPLTTSKDPRPTAPYEKRQRLGKGISRAGPEGRLQ